jgi:hypothetical protein
MVQRVTTKALKDLTVGTADYADESVTNAKLATASVDGRVLANLTVDDQHVNSLAGSKIDDESLLNAKFADASVDGRVVAPDSLDASHFASLDGSILNASSVQGPAIAPGALTTSHYAVASVNSAALGPASVVTDKLAAAAVTYAKIQTGTAGSVLVHGSGGAVEALAAGTEGATLTVLNGAPAWTNNILPSGTIIDYYGYGAPSGWLLAQGGTIGSAASTATAMAADAAYGLYEHLWTFPDTLNPVIGGRGANALSDWNANKPITLPDLKGRATVCIETPTPDPDPESESGSFLDNGRITAATAAAGATVVGASGGAERVTLSLTQIPPHVHVISLQHLNSNNEQGSGKLATGNSATEGFIAPFNSNSAGGNGEGATDPHLNMPPFMLVTKLIKI